MAVVMSLQIPAGASGNKTNLYGKEILTAIENVQNLTERIEEINIRGIQSPMEFQYFEIKGEADKRIKRTNYLAEQELNDKLKKKNKEKLAKVFYICSSLCLVIGSFVGIMISKLHNLYKSKTIK